MKMKIDTVLPVACLLAFILVTVLVIFGSRAAEIGRCVEGRYIKSGATYHYVGAHGCLGQEQYRRYLETKGWGK